MKMLRGAITIFCLAVVLAVAAVLSYALPRHAVVNINGYEVKRVDKEGHVVDAGHPATGATRDVFFINTSDPRAKEVHVYRNEDTRFGFPWYLKFDAAEVQARAQLIEASHAGQGSRPYALVMYYGWRIPMFSQFPNAVDVRPWDRPEAPFPLFNTIFLTVLALLVLVTGWKIWRWRKRRALKVQSA